MPFTFELLPCYLLIDLKPMFVRELIFLYGNSIFINFENFVSSKIP